MANVHLRSLMVHEGDDPGNIFLRSKTRPSSHRAVELLLGMSFVLSSSLLLLLRFVVNLAWERLTTVTGSRRADVKTA